MMVTGVLLLLIGAVAVTHLWTKDRERASCEVRLAQVMEAATQNVNRVWEQLGSDPRTLRYEIKVVDWGPDFTGEGGVLPRWRWVVLDADREVREAFQQDTGGIGGDDAPFMIGNSPTQREAWLAALSWIEHQENPVLAVRP